MKVKAEAQLKSCRFQFWKLKANNDILCEIVNTAQDALGEISYHPPKILPDCACHTVSDKAITRIAELKEKLT